MIFGCIAFVIASMTSLFWWAAEREVLHLRAALARSRTEVLELKGRICDLTDEPDEDDDWPLFVSGDAVETEVGSVFVKGRFIGVTGDGEKLIIQVGHTHFPASPDAVWPVDEPTKGYRDAARNDLN